MKLAQIGEELPNGFHDAEIENLNWNFQTNSAVLDIDFWVATEETGKDKRRQGRLELQGIMFLAIDPPEPRHLDAKPCPPPGRLQIDGILTNEDIFPALPKLVSYVLPGTEIFSFYVSNWNSYIHIAASDAKLIWS